jgi:DnaJ-class molecular chaperone
MSYPVVGNCIHCNGRGYQLTHIAGERDECIHCDGTGSVPVPFNKCNPSTIFLQDDPGPPPPTPLHDGDAIECSACKGKGHQPIKTGIDGFTKEPHTITLPCNLCKGKGYWILRKVTVSEEDE